MCDVAITTLDGKRGRAAALVDTGAFPSVIRADLVPRGAAFIRSKERRVFKTAHRKGRSEAVGVIHLTLRIEGRRIEDEFYIVPDLREDLVIGAKTMQAWDITVANRNGETVVRVGRALDDPGTQVIE